MAFLNKTTTSTSSPLSVYIHVPFCVRKCSYCNFYSIAESDEVTIQRVLSQTTRQLQWFLSRLDHPIIETVYLGGGTPNCVSYAILEDFFISIIDTFRQNSDISSVKEFSVEINPESFQKDQLALFSDHSVSRLSIGVQSFNDDFLSVLGRLASRRQVINTVHSIKKHWKGEFNIDLITAIPGQTVQTAKKDISEATGFHPDHLSVYFLSIEPDTILSRQIQGKEVQLCSPHEEYDIWTNIPEYLQFKGYDHYEISNFSKKGKQCKHNLRYWRMNPYIGCGPAAVSTVSINGMVHRIENPKNIDLFLEGERKKWHTTEYSIDPKAFLFEHVIMGMRLKEGLNKNELHRIFTLDIEDALENTLSQWQRQDYIEVTDDSILPTEKGWTILNRLLLDVSEALEHISVAGYIWP